MDEFEIPEGVDIENVKVYLVQDLIVSTVTTLSTLISHVESEVDKSSEASKGVRNIITQILSKVNSYHQDDQHIAFFWSYRENQETPTYTINIWKELAIWSKIDPKDHPKNQFQ
jgi:hypothetical protein